MSGFHRALVGALASFAATAVAAQVAFATTYPDYFGPDFSFTGIEESSSAFFGAPTGVQNQLLFSPNVGVGVPPVGGTDFDGSTLQVLLTARNPGGTLDAVLIDESGVFRLFGSGSDVGASVFGLLTVTETLSGPIAPLTIDFSAPGVPFPRGLQSQPWSTSVVIDIESVVPDATEATLSLTNQLSASIQACIGHICNDAAEIGIDAASITAIPEPGTFGLMGVGLIGLAIGARRGSRPSRG